MTCSSSSTRRSHRTLEDRIGDALYEIELEHDAVISALVFNRQVWNEARYRALPLHENVDREGIVL